MATFDQNDNVIDMFVNGPQGRIASYYQNNTSYLYYFISDQLGSTRVVMKGTPPDTTYPYTVAEYYNYYPFGQVAEQSGNYPTSFQWTSKEHDQHGGFDYVYFGARYYDPRVGAFGTVDKAGQFASGYVYGANNPIIGIDRDGNFFVIPILLAAIKASAISALSYTAISVPTGNFTFEGLGKAMLNGAVSGGVAAGISYVPSFGVRGAALSLFRSASGSAATSALMKQDLSLSSVARSTLGDYAAGKIIGRYQARSSSMTKNTFSEVLHLAKAGAVSGGVSAALDIHRSQWFKNVTRGVGYGAMGGAGNAIARNIIYGAPIRLDANMDVSIANMRNQEGYFDVTYRKGGLMGMFIRSFEDNGEVNLDAGDEKKREVVMHESYHVLQEAKMGFAEMQFQVLMDLWEFGNNVYSTQGTIEYEAVQNQNRY